MQMNLDLGTLLIAGGVLAAVLFLFFHKGKSIVSRRSPDWASLSLAAALASAINLADKIR